MRATFCIALALLLIGSTATAGEWQKLPSLPDQEGFAGMYAGTSGGALLAAGGANFPDKKPWDGGQKVWYETVFLLSEPGAAWQTVGRLPRPLGYGVSVTHGDGLVCVGGSDAQRHYADAFRLAWRGGKLVTTPLPALPQPVANACGALVGDVLYVAGGQASPEAQTALDTVYRIDLAATKPAWKKIKPCPGGGRLFAVAAACDGAFWIAGGADLVASADGKVERQYLRDAYRYDDDAGWQRVADLPHAVVAAPSPAPADAQGFYILGGDDGSQLGAPPGRHRGFRDDVLRYDLPSGKWSKAGELAAPRVTVPCVRWRGKWIVPSGEARPGVRSPQVWSFAHECKE